MVANALVGRGAADGQAAGDVHPVNHQANSAVIDGKAARRTNVEGDAVCGIDEYHCINREKVGNGGRDWPTDLVQNCVVKKRRTPLLANLKEGIPVTDRCSPKRSYQLAYRTGHRISSKIRIARRYWLR